jgi:hypothetical protein
VWGYPPEGDAAPLAAISRAVLGTARQGRLGGANPAGCISAGRCAQWLMLLKVIAAPRHEIVIIAPSDRLLPCMGFF